MKNVLEDALSEELSILQSVHNVVLAIDYQGRVIVYNAASERVFGIPADQVLGRYISDVIPGTGLLKVLKTGKSHIGRKFVVGNSLYVVNRTPIIRNGAIVGAIGVAQEITELQHLAEELEVVKELKGTLETIFDSSQEGYIAVNNDGQIIMINRAFAELLEVEPGEVIGKHITEVVAESELHHVPRTGRPQYGEIVRIKGRETVVMRYPIRKNGMVIGAVSKVLFRDVNQLVALAEKINNLHRELSYYKSELQQVQGPRYSLDNIIGSSPAMIRLKETIRRVAQGPSTVLIRGESGTGKELVAHALHAASQRRFGRFVKVNCAAVPENLLESELFGYQEGAFTGARKGGQVGKFELASGGTIFLDEIGDMPLAMQAKLLRVLQEKEIERLGDSRPRPVDVRVVAATNRPLEELILEGKFREDLYYRLNVVSLQLPPLREHPEDIGELVMHFINKFNLEFGLHVRDLEKEVWELFHQYNWPGNVRELENVIERAFNMVEGSTLQVAHLPHYLQKQARGKKRLVSDKPLPALLDQVEKEALLEALQSTGGNKLQAARLLGISRAWLYKKMKQYQIDY
ncbi:MAG: sigma 54-interacting transcriptional regulator [Desulfurispora sp.]|uniref:sigma 54-interacting transcriptional regulator n=1 Tax=Desulfurispora sp. TaxID=3014275 RepID=UPI00404AAD1B